MTTCGVCQFLHVFVSDLLNKTNMNGVIQSHQIWHFFMCEWLLSEKGVSDSKSGPESVRV